MRLLKTSRYLIRIAAIFALVILLNPSGLSLRDVARTPNIQIMPNVASVAAASAQTLYFPMLSQHRVDGGGYTELQERPVIHDIAVDDRRQKVWAMSSEGLIRWDMEGSETEFESMEFFSSACIDCELTIDSKDRLWMTYGREVYQYGIDDQWSRWDIGQTMRDAIGSAAIAQTLEEKPGGEMYLGSSKGLLKFDEAAQQWQFDDALFGEWEPSVNQIAFSVDGASMAFADRPDDGWPRGVYLYPTNDLRESYVGNGEMIAFDASGDLWVVEFGSSQASPSHVYRVGRDGNRIEIASDEKITRRHTLHLLRDELGRLLFATTEGMAIRHQNGRWDYSADGSIDLSFYIGDMELAGDGRLWAGGPQGLFRQDRNGAWSHVSTDLLPNSSYRTSEWGKLGSNGEIYFSTRLGLGVLGARGDLDWIGGTQGLYRHNILAVWGMEDGTIWLRAASAPVNLAGTTHDHRLYRIPTEGQVVDMTSTATEFTDSCTWAPSTLGVARPDGEFWLVQVGITEDFEHCGSRFLVFSKEGNHRIEPMPAGAELLSGPIVDTSGTMFWIDGLDGDIYMRDHTDQWTSFRPSDVQQDFFARDLAAAPDGSVWMMGGGNNGLMWRYPDGELEYSDLGPIEESLGLTTGSFSMNRDILVDSAGRLVLVRVREYREEGILVREADGEWHFLADEEFAFTGQELPTRASEMFFDSQDNLWLRGADSTFRIHSTKLLPKR